MRTTSRSRQWAWSWTSRQSFANRSSITGCCGTPRNAQISAVRARWALPPNTTISRTPTLLGVSHPVVRVVRLRLREAELGHDLRLDDLGRGPRVHGDDVFLAPEQVEDRVGLLVVGPQPDRQRLLGVILPGDQLPAALVALAGYRGA